MSDCERECGFAYVLALGDSVEVDLDLGHGQNISGSRHVDEEFCRWESRVSNFVTFASASQSTSTKSTGIFQQAN